MKRISDALRSVGSESVTRSTNGSNPASEGRTRLRCRKVDRPNLDYAAGAAAFSDGTAYVLLKAGLPARLLETHDFGRTWRVVRRWRS